MATPVTLTCLRYEVCVTHAALSVLRIIVHAAGTLPPGGQLRTGRATANDPDEALDDDRSNCLQGRPIARLMGCPGGTGPDAELLLLTLFCSTQHGTFVLFDGGRGPIATPTGCRAVPMEKYRLQHEARTQRARWAGRRAEEMVPQLRLKLERDDHGRANSPPRTLP